MDAWELPVETVFTAGISVLPFAPISAVRHNELPAVIERMKQRLDAEADRTAVAQLWTATKVLLGLRDEADLIEQLLRGVPAMKESTTYRAIMDEGRVEAVRENICLLGEEKFKTPPEAHIQTALDNIQDLEQLHRLLKRILHVDGWDELIAPPAPQTPSTRKKRK